MLSIDQILLQYPEHLRIHKENILKEYLQYKILNIIYNSKYSSKLNFLGGTALRIIYGNTRFSEDLDFDNLGLNKIQWTALSNIIKTDLELEGLIVEIKLKTQSAFRINVRIPELLFDSGLSLMRKRRINSSRYDTAKFFIYSRKSVP